jgi:anti-anti-sigma factor
MDDDDREFFDDARETPPAPVSLDVVRRNGVTVLTLEGELDVLTAPALRDRLDLELDHDRPCVVDLRAVTFIDSSALSALLGAQRRSAQQNLAFILVLGPPGSPVRRLIEIVMVKLDIRADLDTAIEAAQRREQPQTEPPEAPASGSRFGQLPG